MSQHSGFRSQNSKARILFFIICILCSVFYVLYSSNVYAEDNSLYLMRDNLLSYFMPLKGKIISVHGNNTVADIGDKSQVKKGMRFTIFREGTPFVHPVTKEPLGMLETVVGKAEVSDVSPDTSTMTILSGNVKESDRIRISEIGVQMLFYQGRDVDWSLADAYYRVVKDTERFKLIDTALETDNDAEVITEAKRLNADVVLMLSSKDAGGDVMFKQRLFWVDNSERFAEYEAKIATAFIKDLKFGEEFFIPKKSDLRVYADLPFRARLVASGDIDGDGNTELLVSTVNNILFITYDGKVSSLYEIKGSVIDDNIYLDAADMNKNGRAEVIVTFIRNEEIISRIYELSDSKFNVLWEGNVFLRRIGNELIAQEYEHGEGYRDNIFMILSDDGYKRGDKISLPKGVNIYDFVYIDEPDSRRLVLAYDDAGYLNLYAEGNRIWRSKEDYGGFISVFKRVGPTVMVDRGEWSVKDRLAVQKREVFVIKREPLIGIAKGMGYTKSEIKSLWWTGISMEERTVVEDIPGNVLDYAFLGDKLIILDKPVLGIKLENIFKGENPLGNMLFVFSLKGK